MRRYYFYQVKVVEKAFEIIHSSNNGTVDFEYGNSDEFFQRMKEFQEKLLKDLNLSPEDYYIEFQVFTEI